MNTVFFSKNGTQVFTTFSYSMVVDYLSSLIQEVGFELPSSGVYLSQGLQNAPVLGQSGTLLCNRERRGKGGRWRERTTN